MARPRLTWRSAAVVACFFVPVIAGGLGAVESGSAKSWFDLRNVPMLLGLSGFAGFHAGAVYLMTDPIYKPAACRWLPTLFSFAVAGAVAYYAAASDSSTAALGLAFGPFYAALAGMIPWGLCAVFRRRA